MIWDLNLESFGGGKMKFFDVLKKLISLLRLIGIDNQKIYEIAKKTIHDWIIKTIEFENDEIETWLEDLICEITDKILQAVFMIDQEE